MLSKKRGRRQTQRANLDVLRGLMIYLAKVCRQGRAALCEPFLAELTCCLRDHNDLVEACVRLDNMIRGLCATFG